LYPTFFAALAAGIYTFFTRNSEAGAVEHYVTLAFLFIMMTNLVVLSFDFPRTTSLTLFFFMIALGVGLWFLFYTKPDMLPAVGRFFGALTPEANHWFYFLFSAFLGVIYAGVFISVRFDYWEVRPNELLHHHGLLSNLERFSAPHLRIDKEINDIFEFMLCRAGRLVLHPSNERRAIVLENVPFISHKEQQITRMLGALQVQVREER
ncbi:MAG: hypothetical protein ACREJB_02205, partial [Planctomycetaceae bacterium]